MNIQNKLFILIFLQACFLVGCAPKVAKCEKPKEGFQPLVLSLPLVNINIIDRNGLSETINSKERLKFYETTDFLTSQPYQKVLRVFGKDKDGAIRSIITSYHANGQVKQYLEVMNGRAQGQYVEWHPNGKKKLLGSIIAGIADVDVKAQLSWSFDGSCFAWNEEGIVLTQIPYVKGDLHGTARYFHANAALAKEVPYIKGAIDGEMKCYSPDSTLLESTHFSQGTLEGTSAGFWNADCPAWTEYFNDGFLQTGSYFDTKGILLSSVADGCGRRCIFDATGPHEFYEYIDGKPEGQVLVLENNKFLICSYFLKDGEKHGKETLYYSKRPFLKNTDSPPVPKLSVDWYEGKIHGMVKSWYDSSVQESQREMSQNVKQGTLTAWYKNGNLMLIEEYEKDKLVRGEYLKKGESRPISRVEKGKGIATLFDCDGNFNRKVPYQDGRPVDDLAQ